MNNIAISFGKKIPKMQFFIQRKDTEEFVPAIFSEVDCKDEDDYTDVKTLDRKWTFKDYIAQRISEKNSLQQYFKKLSDTSVYEMQDASGQIIGLAQTETRNGVCNIEYIESKPNNEYRYVGQSMVAAIGREALDKKCYKLTVDAPIDEAMPFYINACGFKRYGEFSLKMNIAQIYKLIKQTELDTQAEIIDIKG